MVTSSFEKCIANDYATLQYVICEGFHVSGACHASIACF